MNSKIWPYLHLHHYCPVGTFSIRWLSHFSRHMPVSSHVCDLLWSLHFGWLPCYLFMKFPLSLTNVLRSCLCQEASPELKPTVIPHLWKPTPESLYPETVTSEIKISTRLKWIMLGSQKSLHANWKYKLFILQLFPAISIFSPTKTISYT